VKKKTIRMCNLCGSDDIKYDKFYAICNDCGNLMPKYIKMPSNESGKLPIDYEPEKVKYEGRVVGVIAGDRYITKRNKIHYVRKYAGFGISEKIFNFIKRKVYKIAIIYDSGDGKQEIYYSDIKIWERFGKVEQLSELHDRQIFLPIKYMVCK